jgi:hypothetical protein
MVTLRGLSKSMVLSDNNVEVASFQDWYHLLAYLPF